ncbi:hypothetical protein [Actinotalea sp. Marseille-Q4924]|uniref:hypothetical protein n=1 Tax=Actinotalea sp. Marseille-Q4924 TaxID=2866571 RepID=UPI001CE4616C|nr:hypothetical protein [Actinotalea sp. Marseille-Q4924]
MTSVLIHATGVAVAQGRRNWATTIETPVDFRSGAVAAALSGAERRRLEEVHPEGRAPIWGAHRYHSAKMAQLDPGDVVIFTGNSRVLAIGRIGLLTDNPSLADALWPRHPAHGSYRHVYSLEPFAFTDIPYREFRTRGGFGVADDFRGLRLITGPKADQLLAEFADEIPGESVRRSGTGVIDISHGAARGVTVETPGDVAAPPGLDDLLARLEAMGTTDAAGAARAVRLEQSLLRDSLGIGAAASEMPAQCGLCGRYLPRALLVAAHVKPRSECSEEERLDMPHVAMAACTLGCDALYERGYLAVDATGRIVIARVAAGDAHLRTVLRGLDRHRAPAWSPGREPYFEWHRENRFRGRTSVGVDG